MAAFLADIRNSRNTVDSEKTLVLSANILGSSFRDERDAIESKEACSQVTGKARIDVKMACQQQDINCLVCDIQGLHAKQVWRSVMEEEGHWCSAAELLLARKEGRLSKNISETDERELIDFATGSGMRGNRARVARCDRRFQRLFCNKRRQYHWLEHLRPRVIPETHFSLASAIRVAEKSTQFRVGHFPSRHKNELWFVKDPGKQRGTGIQVIPSSALCGIDKQDESSEQQKSQFKFSDINASTVFQKCIAEGSVACVDGRKADLRMYILQEPSERQRIFLWSDAVVRVAPDNYSGIDCSSLSSQLTNVANGGHILKGTSWKLFTSSFPAIRDMLKRVVQELRPWFQAGRCELLGVDVMLDQSGRPWFVELNGSPSMGGYGTPILFRHKMLKEMLNLAVYPELLRQHKEEGHASKVGCILSCMEFGTSDGQTCSLTTNLVSPPGGDKNQEESVFGKWIPLAEFGVGGDNENNREEDASLPSSYPGLRWAWLEDELVHVKTVEAFKGASLLNDTSAGFKSMGVVGLLSHPDMSHTEKAVCHLSIEGVFSYDSLYQESANQMQRALKSWAAENQ